MLSHQSVHQTGQRLRTGQTPRRVQLHGQPHARAGAGRGVQFEDIHQPAAAVQPHGAFVALQPTPPPHTRHIVADAWPFVDDARAHQRDGGVLQREGDAATPAVHPRIA